jgi:tRNA threonylcarbamoyladenosine biosynthesis protein TsaE
MEQAEFITRSGEETKQLGAKLGKLLKAGSLVTLSGELGAGKTTFTQGIGQGLGVKKNITSPTFTLMKNYTDGRLPLYHIDAYRLENVVQDLGFDEVIEGDGVCVIEWADFLAYVLPPEVLALEFFIQADGSRRITAEAKGAYYQEVLAQLCSR